MVDTDVKMYSRYDTNDSYPDSGIIEEDGNGIDKNMGDEELPMALVVEDEEICQNFLQGLLKEMNIQTRVAASVEEAKKVYLELTEQGISIDIVFLDIYLKDNSTGIQFLKIIKQNNWLERALIIVMSGNEDDNIIKECYNYNIQNFLRKPITRASFYNEKFKINRYLDTLKCPLSEYKIEKKLGGGASGIVHLVRHRKTRELFALKTVILDQNKNDQERRLHKNLKSPTIIDLRESRIIDNNLYMVLEYAEFGTLSQYLKEKKEKQEKISTDIILDWMTELFLGLFTIHEKRLMHRDIKSDNLFLCKNNVLKIGDLGIAKASELGKTVCGTVFYMAPEMFHFKEYYSTVDIWAAGVVLYEMIMFKKPFEGSSTDEIQSKIQTGTYEQIPEKTDKRLKKIIDLCLNLDPILRLSALEILRLDFISERVKKLFESKILVNDNIYNKMLTLLDPNKSCIDLNNNSSTDNSPIISENFDSLAAQDLQKFRDYYINFKLGFKIDSMAMKSSYKPGYFSKTIENVIKGSDLKICAKTGGISKEELQKLIKDKFLINLSNPSSMELDLTAKAYYEIKLFENDKIDNSIKFSIGSELSAIEDAVQLSIECLAQAEYINNKMSQADNENFETIKADLLSSQCFVSFLYDVKKLKFLKMESYLKEEKLAIMLNVYQTMYIHSIVKSLMTEDLNQNGGFLESFKSIFRKASRNVEITYEISNQILSLYEMKHIVIRRNRKPLNAYFRLASGSDPRINFIEEDESMLMKLHMICLDPEIGSNEERERYLEPKFRQFKTSKIYDDIDEFCRMWLEENVEEKEDVLYIPKFLKDYMVDFGNSEEEMIKTLFSIDENNKKDLKRLLKNIKSKEIIINYY